MYKKIKKNYLTETKNKFNINFYHKPNTFNIPNNYYDYCHNIKEDFTGNDDSEIDSDNDYDNDKEEYNYNKEQRKIVKNKMILNNNNFKKISNMKIKNEETKKFIGSYEQVPNSKLCQYCDKFIDKNYFIPLYALNNNQTLDYCMHCWGWLNFNDVKLTEGLYFGNLNQNIVFDYIKKSIEPHKKIGCTNQNCIFNEYEKLEKSNKLNIIFCKEIKENNINKNISKENKIYTRDININWEKSSISI